MMALVVGFFAGVGLMAIDNPTAHEWGMGLALGSVVLLIIGAWWDGL